MAIVITNMVMFQGWPLKMLDKLLYIEDEYDIDEDDEIKMRWILHHWLSVDEFN